MTERIKDLDSEATATAKELKAMSSLLNIKKRDLVTERQNLADCTRKLGGKDGEVSRLGGQVNKLEKDLEAKTKECQKEAKRRKALDAEVEDLKAKVHASKSVILREFESSQEYKDVMGINYSEGYTDMLNMCINHFGVEKMEWAIPSEGDLVTLKELASPPGLNPKGVQLAIVRPNLEVEYQVVQDGGLAVAERIEALEDDFQEVANDQLSASDREVKVTKVVL